MNPPPLSDSEVSKKNLKMGFQLLQNPPLKVGGGKRIPGGGVVPYLRTPPNNAEEEKYNKIWGRSFFATPDLLFGNGRKRFLDQKLPTMASVIENKPREAQDPARATKGPLWAPWAHEGHGLAGNKEDASISHIGPWRK